LISLSSGVRIDVCPITALQGAVLQAEASLLDGVSQARAREIIAGRNLARRMMKCMGLPAAPILRDQFGAPIWPTGLCGSIAHSRRHVALALSYLSELRSVGIDIVDGDSLGQEARSIATNEEIQAFVASSLASGIDEAANLIFSAKEALFKCQASITGNQDLDWLEVRLSPGADGTVSAAAPSLPPLFEDTVRGIRILLEQIQGVNVFVAALR